MEEKQNQNSEFRCEKVDHCPFFIELNGSCEALVNKLKQQYCLSDNSQCSRYYLSQVMGAKNVPVTMMPHQWEWVNQILKDAGKTAEMRNPEDVQHPFINPVS